MVKIYVRMVREGRITLDKIPKKWREAVRQALESGENAIAEA